MYLFIYFSAKTKFSFISLLRRRKKLFVLLNMRSGFHRFLPLFLSLLSLSNLHAFLFAPSSNANTPLPETVKGSELRPLRNRSLNNNTKLHAMPDPTKEDTFFGKFERFYHELVPWGDPQKGFSAVPGKRDAMVVKYMERAGCTKETAEKEVDEYLLDKEGYVIRKRAEEAKEKTKNKKG